MHRASVDGLEVELRLDPDPDFADPPDPSTARHETLGALPLLYLPSRRTAVTTGEHL